MKIFWSWQSDHPGKISRHLIREALELAVVSLNEELDIEEPERTVTLDHDRKGVPGSPDLANVILEKIRESAAFVADVTPVGETPSDPPKKLMNSNVAIELGYALHTVTDRRLIMVMNTAYGTRADLPFDLQHKAGPIFYKLGPDAHNEEIKEARKQLVSEFKVALREMIRTLPTERSTLEMIPSRATDAARYYAPGQALFTRRNGQGGVGEQPFTVAETPTLYLRIRPTRPVEPLKRADALNLIRQGPNQLDPFYHSPRGSSFEANEFGAIAFDADYSKGEILCAAQVFLNREIWAFNTVCFSPKLAKSRSRNLGIPTLSVEQTFAICLPQYARFVNDKLRVAPPYRIEGGAVGVKDYVIFMPGNYFEQEWGPIQQDELSWSGTLPSLNAEDIDACLLCIFEPFFDAGACSRPSKLYGFPGDPPGTLPHG